MKKVIVNLTGLLMIVLAAGTGCNKPSSDKTFSITGYLWDSCGGKPLSGVPLQVSFRELNMVTGGVSDDNIGSATTGNDGRFEIKCKYYNRGTNIDIFNANTGYVYCDNYPYISNPKEGYYDFGQCFALGTKFSGVIKFTLNGTFSPTDTFFVGNGSEYRYLTNIKSGDTFQHAVSYVSYHGFYNKLLYYDRSGSVNWGMGYAEYKALKHLEYIVVGICSQPDTVTNVTITR